MRLAPGEYGPAWPESLPADRGGAAAVLLRGDAVRMPEIRRRFRYGGDGAGVRLSMSESGSRRGGLSAAGIAGGGWFGRWRPLAEATA